MNGRSLAGLAALAACLLAFLFAGPSEVAAQDRRSHGVSARSVARDWANKLHTALRLSPRRNEAGKRLALRPFHPDHFEGLTAAQRRRIYDWLLEGLAEVVRDTYSIMDPAELPDISRVLEERGAQDWFERYEEVLRRNNARINVICRGIPGERHIRLNCSALDITDGASLGRASTAFELEWLNEPVALELAVGSVTGEILRTVKPGAVGKVRIVDTAAGGEESPLSRYIGGLLGDAMHRRIRTGPGWRVVDGSNQGAPHDFEGEVQILDDRKLVLRVVVKLEGSRLYSARRYISLRSIPTHLLDPSRTGRGTEKRPGAKPGQSAQLTGVALQEAVQAGDINRVERLLAAGADVNGRDGTSWTGLMHAATRGYTLVVELLLRAGADSGIRAVDGATALFMASARGHLEIVTMLLKADADPDVMGPRGMRAAEAAAEGGHPRIVGLLKAAKDERDAHAKARRLDTVAAYDAFLEKYREGPRAEGARRRRAELLESHNELDNKAYARARALDTVKAYEAYLAEYPDGRHVAAAKKRIKTLDDEAYARARALDTVKAYEAYLAEYPDGRHVAAARKRIRTLDDEAYARARRLDTVEAYEAYLAAFPKGIHAREARERKWQSVEAVLGLEQADRVAIQRGLVSMGKDVGAVDGVFGKRTRRAIREWQREKGMAVTGYLTREQAEALKVLGEAVMQREAAQAAEAAVAEAARAAEAARLEQQKKELERLRPGREFRDCAECPEMVVVRKGEYMMGSPGDEKGRYDDEGPRRRVTIPYVFAVGRYEITAEEFGRFVRETGHDTSGGCRYWERRERKWKGDKERSWSDPGYPQTGRDPVVCVSWKDAKGYLKWLREKTGKEYRLLSEAEWEYVTRGGSTTRYWWGDLVGEGKANCNGCRSGWDGKKTASVKSFEANAFGLYGVHGNVWEWMEDCWHDNYNGAPTDGSAWVSSGECGRRVLRSGSWLVVPKNLRSAVRHKNSPGVRNYSYGFRVARTLSP